jgi:glycosyltransferase involved in cell wall biosynthesis
VTLPLVSCVVPVYNGERYLRETLDSILAQTYTRIDLLVVDDGSTDGTARVVREYSSRVRYIVQPNGGLGEARNRGIQEAAGELVAFLDADDLWLEEKLARQVARFEARPELDLCVTAFQNFWMADASADEARFREHAIAQPLTGYVVPTLLSRRSAFDRFGLFDPALRYSPGAPWMVQAVARGAVLEALPEVLMRRRLHGANMSRTASAPSMEGLLHVIKGRLEAERRGRQVPLPDALVPPLPPDRDS